MSKQITEQEAYKRIKTINPKLKIIQFNGWTVLSLISDGKVEYKARLETIYSNKRPWLYHPTKGKTSKFLVGLSLKEALQRLKEKLPSVEIANYKSWTKECDFYCNETKLKWVHTPSIAMSCTNLGRPKIDPPKDMKKHYNEKLQEKFGNKYKLITYKVYKSVMRCKKHGKFIKAPWACLNQKYGGCVQCRLEQQEQIKQLNLQEQRKIKYPNKVRFLDKTRWGRLYSCPIHGNFYATEENVLKGCGCLRCIADQLVKTKNDLAIPKGIKGLPFEQHLEKLRTHYTWLKIKPLPDHKVKCKCTICSHKWETHYNNLRSSILGCPLCGRRLASLKTANEPKVNTTTNNSKVGLTWIYWLEKTFNTELYGSHNKSEHKIKLPNGKIALIDGYNPKTKEVFEFLGDYWHGNPMTKYKNKDHYANTMKRLQIIASLGYTVHYVWEKDFNSGIGFSGTIYATKL